jgi:Holliday junction resolvasome RuvABC DNA-binding subunit
VELKEKFINDISNIAGSIGGDRQVVEALLSLGYKEKEAMEMIKKLQGNEPDLSAKIKKVLQN